MEENVHEESVDNAEATGRHQVDDEGHVFARSDQTTEGNPPDIGYKVDDPQKDQSPAVPMQSPLEQVPERHQHGQHDEEAVDASVEDADFDAEETNRKGEDSE